MGGKKNKLTYVYTVPTASVAAVLDETIIINRPMNLKSISLVFSDALGSAITTTISIEIASGVKKKLDVTTNAVGATSLIFIPDGGSYPLVQRGKTWMDRITVESTGTDAGKTVNIEVICEA